MAGKRAAITPDSSLRLWVAAGGRCEYCNEYLLADGFTGSELNLAEQAHIVGASDTPGSPRGAADIPLAARAKPENLMLLCRAHHRVIDRLIAEHTVEGLLRMKREHEARILALTSITAEQGSVVLRVIGAVRGAPVQIPRSTIAAAVTADGRFPRYPLTLASEDIEIDLRNLPEEGGETYWSVGERIIEQAAQRIRDAQGPIAHLSVFAIARIPLLVALGFHLDDKIAATIYQRRRDGTGDGEWLADPDAPTVSFEEQQTVRRAGELTGGARGLPDRPHRRGGQHHRRRGHCGARDHPGRGPVWPRRARRAAVACKLRRDLPSPAGEDRAGASLLPRATDLPGLPRLCGDRARPWRDASRPTRAHNL